ALALHYQDAAPFRVREDELLALLSELGTGKAYRDFISRGPSAAAKPFDLPLSETDVNQQLQAGVGLANALLPIHHWLDTQRLRFTHQLGDSVIPRDKQLSESELAKRLAPLTQADAGADHLITLQRQVLIARHSRGETRDRALVDMTDSLQALGETFLAERMLKLLIVKGNPQQQQLALEKLETFFAVNHDNSALLNLHAAAFVLAPTRLALARLVNTLAATGDFHKAILLGLLLEDKTAVRDNLLTASINLRYWRVFDRLSASLPAESLPLWLGRRHEAVGNFTLAEKHYRNAADNGQAALERLNEGLAIVEQLASDDESQRHSAVEAWSSWQASTDGIWQTSHEIITGHGGVRLIDNPSQGLLSRYFIAEDKHPMQLEFIGPVKLRLLARPLHPAASDAPRDAWLLTSNGDNTQVWMDRFLISNNRPSQSLQLTQSDQQVGRLETRELSFGPGMHRLEIRGLNTPMLVSTEILRPALPSAVLPWLTPARANAAVKGAGLSWPGQPPLPDTSPLAQMHALLWRLQRDGISQQLLAEADRLAQSHPQLKPLALRFNQQAEWQEVTDIESGSGFYQVELTSWQPQSRAMQVRAALLAPVKATERVLSPGNKLGLELYASQDEILPLRLRAASLPFLPRQNVIVRYQLNGGRWHQHKLSEAHTHTINIELDRGYHHLLLEVAEAFPNHLVFVDIDHELLNRPQERSYHIATHELPLIAHVEGPAWVRIEQRNANTSQFRYREIKPGWQALRLTPSAGQDQALFRVHRHEPVKTMLAKPMQTALPASAPSLPRIAASPPLTINDSTADVAQPLGGEEDGTWTFGLSQVKRQFADDEETAGNDDDFLELSGSYRERSEAEPQWWRGTLLYRFRDHGDTIGFKGNLWQQLEAWPVNLNLNLFGYLQDLDSGNEWSLYASSAITQRRDLGLRTYHLPRLEMFARQLSTHGNDVSSFIDSDVYSDYKNDHRHGVRLSDTLVHRPWQDTEWRARLAVTSNESLLSADNLSLALEWRQRLGLAQVN
ncbi:MAG: hypothetical protein R3260_17525, partial [Pseudomonas sp.]|nr:hypothetical protein [Pseudomonas sp.]